jgi:REP element-mobilizing transposase RayT
MDRHWLLSSTTYGNWLPGDPRGFVSDYRSARREKILDNVPGTPYAKDMPELQEHARVGLKGPPIILTAAQADAMFAQFYETATIRNWKLFAVGIMAKHVHLVVGVLGDPDPNKVLGDFKSYASRTLNAKWGSPKSETWWTERGSTRKLRDEAALLAAIEYVRNQENPLLIWIAGENPPPVLDLASGVP